MYQKKSLKNYIPKFTKGVLIILLLIIQSCGINFFEKKGAIIAFVVLVLSRNGLLYITNRDIKYLLYILIFLLFNKTVNPAFDTEMLFYQFTIVLEAYIFLLSYTKKGINRLINDFYDALNFIFLHALIGFGLYIIFPFLFKPGNFNYPYKTFLYLFYVSGDYGGLARNNGLLWEPGLLQLMLNIFLFYSIAKNKSFPYLILITICILSTFSTSGFFCLGTNYIFFIFYNIKKKRKIFLILLITSLSTSILYLIWFNITEKLGGENLSGLARYRDLYIGIELIKERPLFGHGLFKEQYLFSKSYVSNIEFNLFGKETLDIIGSISGGYVNGFLDIFIWFGVPTALFIFILFYKNKFVQTNKLGRFFLYIIMCFTFFAEPITYTPFFLLFPFSTIIFKKNVAEY